MGHLLATVALALIDMAVERSRTNLAYTFVFAFVVGVSFVLQGCGDTSIVARGENPQVVVSDYSIQPSNESTTPIQKPNEFAELDQSPSPAPALRATTTPTTPTGSGR